MKITRVTPRSEVRPFNVIYEAFGKLLIKLFEERVGSNAYVNMPKPQQEIIDFCLSGTQEVGLIVGDIGIGKTSVISYLKKEIWSKDNCWVLLKDFKPQSESEALGEDFYLVLNNTEQRARANAVARDRIKEILRGHLIKIDPLSNDQAQEEFVGFLTKYYPGTLPVEHILHKQKASDSVFAIRSGSELRLLTKLFIFTIQKNKIRHIKLVLDNLDDKDSLLIRCLVEYMAHLSAEVAEFSEYERMQDPEAPQRWLTALVACRPLTAGMLKSLDSPKRKGWFGFHEIVITEPCSLTEAISKRYEILIGEEAQSGSRNLRLEMVVRTNQWLHDNRDIFFHNICKSFENSGQTAQLVQICNYNMADAMSAMMEVIRNRHFMKEESLLEGGLASTKPESRLSIYSHSDPFTNTTVLRALAYGNQGKTDSPMYPIDSTRVPNVLDSRHARFGESSLKPRLIGMFNQNAGIDLRGTLLASVTEITETAEFWFGVSAAKCNSLIDELFYQGILGNSRIDDIPSRVGNDCQLSITPRGVCLWQQLALSSVLLQCYRDDVDLKSDLSFDGRRHHWKNKPTMSFTASEAFGELFWMIMQCWQCEKRELKDIVSRGLYEDFASKFGDKPLTLILIEGVRASHGRFFRYYSDMIMEEYYKMLGKIEREIFDIISLKIT